MPLHCGSTRSHHLMSSMACPYSLIFVDPLVCFLVLLMSDWMNMLPCGTTCVSKISEPINDCNSVSIIKARGVQVRNSLMICLCLQSGMVAIMARVLSCMLRYVRHVVGPSVFSSLYGMPMASR